MVGIDSKAFKAQGLSESYRVSLLCVGWGAVAASERALRLFRRGVVAHPVRVLLPGGASRRPAAGGAVHFKNPRMPGGGGSGYGRIGT